MVEAAMLHNNTSPRLLEVWIQQQERLKQVQMTQQQSVALEHIKQQQTVAIEHMKQLYSQQQHMSGALRPAAAAPTIPSADTSPYQVFLFNMFYYQVR